MEYDDSTLFILMTLSSPAGIREGGIGTWLAESAVAALAPYRLKRLMLFTLDAHEVYARAGFSAVSESEKLMLITAPATSTVPTDPATGGVKPLATDLKR
jgi:N-acetylglutamate synthase-like GNAT family acetyltransferase